VAGGPTLAAAGEARRVDAADPDLADNDVIPILYDRAAKVKKPVTPDAGPEH
jgi:hypothetical protein